MRSDEYARALISQMFAASDGSRSATEWTSDVGSLIREALAENGAGTMWELASAAHHAFTAAAEALGEDPQRYYQRWALADAGDKDADETGDNDAG